MKILVTGAAGFIGFHTAQLLLARGDEVVGLDNLNDYYDVAKGLDTREAATAQYRPHPMVEGLIPAPQVRTVSPATTQVDGRAVYVATASEEPVSLFITEAGEAATAISLTLAPRHIPPREVRLVLQGGQWSIVDLQL